MIFVFGSLALQIPIGRLSGLFDRRLVLTLVASVTGMVSVAIIVIGSDAGI